MVKILLAIAVVLAFFATNRQHTEGLATQPPNIIYINMDDMGVEETEPYGNRIIKTPNLTRMAHEGILFTQHYCGTAVCAPSRCALMTGKHTGHCEVRGNIQVAPHGQMPLSDATVTVAELLRQAGYQTQLYGKWGLGCENTTGEPTRQGFNDYFGYLDQVLAHNNFPEYLLRNGQKQPLPNQVIWEPKTAPFKGYGSFTPNPIQYSNDLFTEETLKFIGQPHSKPFFVYLAYTLPHNNGEAPWDQRFQSPTLKPYENKAWAELDKNYGATVSRMDDYLGRIMAKMRATGLDKNTIVFFTSDNGSTADIPERFAANNQLRGFKRSPYEGGIRAPLVVWGNGIKPGRTSDLLSAQWDFLATACEIARIAPPSDTDGLSMLPTIQGRKQPKKHNTLYWEFHERGGWQTLRQGNEKLIYQVKTNTYEYYNLRTDPGEKTNLALQQPQRVAELKTLLEAARTPSEVFNFGK